MKMCWLDIRGISGTKEAIIEEAIHQRVDAVVADNPADLAPLPPTVKRVLFPQGDSLPEDLGSVDLVIVKDGQSRDSDGQSRDSNVEYGRFVEITDAASLEQACRSACRERWSVLSFRDPTKIPLEIVIAAAADADGSIITQVADVEEAQIVFGVLEHGSDGVMLAPQAPGEATSLKVAAAGSPESLSLEELEVTAIRRAGLGDRVCVDTCSQFRPDEGILVGSYSHGMILCCSETHPLPYMPTRPFRVNAGALHSYTLAEHGRTRYLSELDAGGKVLAVDCKGQARIVTVGRVKIERRPMLAIDAVSASGTTNVNLIVQDDWHVRVLGPGGEVLNVTDLAAGTKVLGYLPVEQRHVGYPIDEFCIEK